MRSFLSAGLLLIFASASGLARAQDQTPSASDIALARSLGLEGAQLADGGNCPAAIEKLQRAESLYHAPSILVRLGECQVATGKLVLGTENLQRVARESLPPKAPKAFVDAQARAKKLLESALAKVAKLKIHVEAPAGVRPVVKLDGEMIPAAALDLDRPADPGSHVVEASAPGFLSARTDTMLPEGGAGSAVLKLEPDPNAAPQLPPPGGYPAAPMAPGVPQGPAYGPAPGQPPLASPPDNGGAPPASEGKGARVAGIVLLSVGGAGIVAGSVMGAVALGKKTSLDNSCGPNKTQCPASAQGDIDSLKNAAIGSTVGFAVGGAAAVTGLILLITAKHSTTTGSTGNKLALEPLVSPRSVGLRGEF